ncbi:EAL domain-containing protein [Niallia taxi]|uniref:putative bifunctional diguanylate cyclase/phosphodiesterase n=1 Tax=Niallia taxi TaxID=2499688 RepID=UPI0021A50DA8|nr:EAL domain-containing protein [Niallia taxi]MCT2346555.1 EAL domain-containing protein [Niallia taxi]MDE5055972.1 EAL domain-containing protein [Niallia taxi]MED3965497.1 EAL domain-containing protein [Niallia taxi]WOD62930.1 EAL domain-containing protein [Niallia taxi]
MKRPFNIFKNSDMRIPLIYLIISACWVLFSSYILTYFTGDLRNFASYEMLKGWIFICVTSVILYLLIRRERIRNEQSNRRRLNAEFKFRTLVEESLLGIYILHEGRFAYVNSTFLDLSGYSSKELLQMHFSELILPLQEGNEVGLYNNRAELQLKKKDGTMLDVVVLSHKVSVIHNDAPAIMGSVLDNTEKRKYQRKLERLAFYDPLTNLANRRMLSQSFEETLSNVSVEKDKLALLFIDLDHFKGINDSIGHDMGDKVLKGLAERIVGCIPERGLVSRYGGDEFTVMIPDIQSEQEAEIIANDLITTFNEPLYIENQEFYITLSIGIAIFPVHGEELETLEKNADIAMYFAKEKGRNNSQLFTKSMRIFMVERLHLQHELRKAIENIDNHFFLVYQPKIDVVANKVLGVEALLRWKHPETGLISPARFIPIAEEMGTINALSKWVMNKASRQLRSWNEKGIKMSICINVSPLLFQQADFVESTLQAIEEAGVKSCDVQLEITESVLTNYLDEAIDKLNLLKSNGLTIAIDDFGTGYSSLSVLRKMPIDRLKIDQSFIRDLQKDKEIVALIISMANKLGMHVTAEGVETLEQCKQLQDLHCSEMQGYYFSKPITAEEMEEYLKRPPISSSI